MEKHTHGYAIIYYTVMSMSDLRRRIFRVQNYDWWHNNRRCCFAVNRVPRTYCLGHTRPWLTVPGQKQNWELTVFDDCLLRIIVAAYNNMDGDKRTWGQNSAGHVR